MWEYLHYLFNLLEVINLFESVYNLLSFRAIVNTNLYLAILDAFVGIDGDAMDVDIKLL